HNLQQIQDQLRVPIVASGEVFTIGGEPYLAPRGLLRLTLHVLEAFVWSQESVEREDFNWKTVLPGTVKIEIDPKHWVWIEKAFVAIHARKQLSGLLEHFEGQVVSGGGMVDLRKLMQKCEGLMHTSKEQDRIAMLAMYWLYNAWIDPENNLPNWELVLQKNEEYINTLCIEMMVVHMLTFHDFPWTFDECHKTYATHQKERFQKNSTRIPLLIDMALRVRLANLALHEGLQEQYRSLLEETVLDAAGRKKIQDILNTCLAK
ncbi:unnamed protein product, partial [marine sediment metagenome]